MNSVHEEYVLAIQALKSYAGIRSDNELAAIAGVNQSRLSKTLRDPAVTVTTEYIATLLEPFEVTLDTFFLWGRQALAQQRERAAQARRRLEEDHIHRLRLALAEGDAEAVAAILREQGESFAESVRSHLATLPNGRGRGGRTG